MYSYVEMCACVCVQLLLNHPLFASNAAAQEQIRAELPFLLAQVRSRVSFSLYRIAPIVH